VPQLARKRKPRREQGSYPLDSRAEGALCTSSPPVKDKIKHWMKGPTGTITSEKSKFGLNTGSELPGANTNKKENRKRYEPICSFSHSTDLTGKDGVGTIKYVWEPPEYRGT